MVEVVRNPFVYYVEDNWPESVILSGFLLRRVIDCTEKVKVTDMGLDGINACATA